MRLLAGGLDGILVRRSWEVAGYGMYFTADYGTTSREAQQLLRDAWHAFTGILGEVTDQDGDACDMNATPAEEDYAEIPLEQLVPLRVRGG